MSDANDCLFCGIAGGRVKADKVFEDEAVLAFRDVNPQAPTHLLVLPRAHVQSAAHLGPEHDQLWARMLRVAQSLAEAEGISSTGYRLVINIGRDGGQTVDHLHMHLLGGRHLSWPPG